MKRYGRMASMLLIFALISGCNEIDITSRRLERDVIVDGLDTEWDGARYLIDKQYITIGALNDDNYLYLRFSTPDRMKQTRIAALGCTVWFDTEGGTKKRLGIHFPIGRNRPPAMPPSGHFAGADSVHTQRMRAILDSTRTRIELIGPGEKERTTIDRAEAETRGILIATNISKNILVHELRIPLRQTGADGFTVQPKTGKPLGVGIELGHVDSKTALNLRKRDEKTEKARELRRRGFSQMSNPMIDSYELWVRVFLTGK